MKTAHARGTIVVCGMIAGVPHKGGATWAVLQYLLGFRSLGYETVFIEPLAPSTLSPAGLPIERSLNAAYFQEVMSAFGFDRASALLQSGTTRTVGLPYADLRAICDRADILINISGMLDDERLMGGIPVRIYMDLDPAFNQLWAMQGIDVRFAGHTHFVTVGQALGEADCSVPTCGFRWIPTLQPVALGYWPVGGHITHDALTTVGHWRSYGSITYDGVFYGQRAHTFRQFITLPGRTRERLTPAIAVDPDEKKDLEALEQHGWQLIDPARVTHTPSAYQTFVQESKAELCFAKSGYVTSRCGWFSDRSVCYLASGRPVIATETGFSRFLPTGKGLLAFSTEEELVAGIEKLCLEYPQHAAAARTIAEEHFDSDKVLTRLLQRVGTA